MMYSSASSRPRLPFARNAARSAIAVVAGLFACLSAQTLSAAEVSPADILREVSVTSVNEEIALRCGIGGDFLQMELEKRKLAFRQWARAKNSARKASTPAALLGYFSNDPRTVPTWLRQSWAQALDSEHSLRPIRHPENDSDMGLQSWVRLMYLYGNDPLLPASAAQSIRRALVDFRYWLDDPIRSELEREQQFWTENHQIMYSSAEFLVGQLLPNERFRDGKTGAEHRARALRRVDQWLSWRLYHGFNEWNSPVYYEYTFTALLNLVDFSQDERIATRAAMALDLLIFDLARFTQNGSFGATSGRVYAEHKYAGWRQSIGDLVQMLFGTRGVWPGGGNKDLWVNTRARDHEETLRSVRAAGDRHRSARAIHRPLARERESWRASRSGVRDRGRGDVLVGQERVLRRPDGGQVQRDDQEVPARQRARRGVVLPGAQPFTPAGWPGQRTAVHVLRGHGADARQPVRLPGQGRDALERSGISSRAGRGAAQCLAGDVRQ
jgi:hypothetical protein